MNLAGTWFWEPKIRSNMNDRFPWRTPQQTRFTDETVRTLHRAYVAALTAGAKRFEFISAPGRVDLGVPSPAASKLIVSIGKSTNLGTETALVFASAMTYLFTRGEIGQDIFDPIVKKNETAVIDAALPPGKNVLDVLTTGAKTAGLVLPVALVAAGALLILVYVPRPRR